MEKSIETIWKEGFLDKDALIAPKINNLYDQKSKNIVDKMMRMMKINIIAIYAFAAGFLAYALLTGIPVVISIFVFLLFVMVGVHSQIQIKKTRGFNKGRNSFEYLKGFELWLKSQVSRNVVLSRFFYPVAFLAAISMVWFSNGREKALEKLLNKYPDIIMVGGVPLYFLLGVMVIVVLMAIFAGKIYRLDIGIVYGRVFKKLQEIISDLEELRS